MSTPLYTVAQLRAIEQQATAKEPSGALMQRAGEAAAAWIAAHCQGRRVLVMCGPGNNGGDGYVCALALLQRGYAVQCLALADPTTHDAIAAQQRWSAACGVTVNRLVEVQHRAFDVIVDALFGIGLTRPLAGDALAWTRWINEQRITEQRINAQRAFVVALDVPSGLDADRGTWVGAQPGVQAHTCITFLGAKPGLYTADGCDAAREIAVETLQVAAAPSNGTLNEPHAFAALLKCRPRNTHKGSFGKLAVVGGGAGMVGAPLLAARAGLRLGAGRVYVVCVNAPELRVDPLQPELMFRALPLSSAFSDLDALVIGCGLGTATDARDALAQARELRCPTVIDADALNLLAAELTVDWRAWSAAAPIVLTPHPLEAARLLQTSVHSVQSDRVNAALTLAAQTSAIVVLKGAGTIIAVPDGRYWINPTGGPALATAGTGDVLAGMIGALIAQRNEQRSEQRDAHLNDVLESVLAAVWLHGAAADEFGADTGLVASDIAPLAARRLHALHSSSL